ncbi:DUF2971 domain-containing protein [Cupriavidus sp. CP313]
MRLYYLTAQIWAEKILRERRLKLSTIDELNDPFELQGVAIGERQLRRIYRLLHEHWTKNIGMICTSTSWQSPVMWAHYGDKHRGVCLGFDVEDAEVHQVRYEPHRLVGLLDDLVERQAMTQEQLTTILTTKFKDWRYEQEWRIFASLADRKPSDGRYFLSFAPHLKLREVIVGARCDASIEAIAALVPRSTHAVEVFKARPAFDSFRIVRQQRVAPIIVAAE